MRADTTKIHLVIFTCTFFVLSSGAVFANSCGHGHADPGASPQHKGMSHQMPMMMNRPVQTVEVSGLKISLDVMDMAMHVHMQEMKRNPLPGGFDRSKSHAVMVMIKSLPSQDTVEDATVSVTIISPKGETTTSKTMWSGDHFGSSFTPSERGAYKIRVKVEGKARKGEAEFKYQA